MTAGVPIRAAAYVFAIATTLLVCRLKQLPLRDTLALKLPSTRQAFLYSFLFIVLAAMGEWLATTLGVPAVAKWPVSTLATLVARVVTIVVLAPAAEELLFRGLLYTQISKTPLGAAGAIVLPAVLFAAAHYDKGSGAAVYLLILIDGLYCGFVRFKTDSTLLTLCLHSIGNAFAVVQRWP
jgi:uncharacterized protein